MQPRALLVMLVTAGFALAACGDDGVHHLADAPPQLDAPAIDAPPGQVHLAVAVGGNGTGTVASTPDGISCGATCDATFTQNTVVTLTAIPGDGSVFGGWGGGACSGALPTCDVTLADATTVTATFTLAMHTVHVTTAGAGTGTVSGNGLDCGATCTVSVAYGTQISLAAVAGNLSVFAGWGGACSGNGACSTTITDDTEITANFALDDVTLFVSKGGNGAGTVTSTAAGIACGATCMHTYTAGDMVTLNAAPTTGSTFTGWSGGGATCTGTGACMLTMTGATTVTATFALQTHVLTVAKDGTGTGSVTSNPAGIACGADCSESETYGQAVVLTATPGANSTFGGWMGGGCSGTATTCTVSVTAATTVTATFDLVPETLTIAFAGNGAGTVAGGSVSCTGDCTKTLDYGTTVVLTATPSTAVATASQFAGWSGDCTGMGTCSVTLTAAANVTATFTLVPNLMFVSSTVSNGNLGGVDGADATCKMLAKAAGFDGTYIAFISSATSATITQTAISRVGSATGWMRPDGKAIMDKPDQWIVGTLTAPPSMSDKKVDVTTTTIAWTGTDKSGGFATQCSVIGKDAPWTNPAPSGTVGIVTSKSATFMAGGSTTCDSMARIYCVGIDRKAFN